MKKKTLLIFLIGLLPTGIFAQVRDQMEPDNVADLMESSYYDYQRTSSFLGIDPSKIKIDHNYTLSFGSFGTQSMTQGSYLNTISYQFTAPLSLKFQWGFYHQPFATGMPTNLASQFFISGAELKYQPFKNTTFKFQFKQYPQGYYSPYDYRTNGWNHPLNRDSWFDEE
jgi:hypothetical protein